jgi:type IX secretion system substrate protein/receptor L domain-containing protein
MKKLLLSAAFLLFSIVGFGQCPPQITLESQTEVDNFSIDFPGCTNLNILSINGTGVTDLSPLSQIETLQQLNIFNTSITDFDGMENVTSITEQFRIFENPNITTLVGFGNLENITGTTQISDNPNLTSLTGIEGLTEFAGNLNILRNNALINLSGLENVTEFDGFLQILENESLEEITALDNVTVLLGTLAINNNDALTSISGLDNLQIIGGGGDLIIESNAALENLGALSNLIFLNGRIRIIDNPLITSLAPLSGLDPTIILQEIRVENNAQLSECDIAAICENFDTPSITTIISNNLSGCNSIAEVEVECSIVDIPDNNFLDALVNHTPTIDTNSDGNIQFDEAEAFTGTMNVANEVISDFTGLEAFVNITGFDGSGNFMTRLSLETNTALTSVDFSDCPDVEKVFMKNGSNAAITNFNGLNCPTLEFICVDDVAFAQANFTSVDPQVQFVDDCELLSVVGFNLSESISVYPNPVSENLIILIDSNLSFIKAEIYTISGQKLMETSAKQIDFSNLSAGIYFVNVVTDEGTLTKKIVKQ